MLVICVGESERERRRGDSTYERLESASRESTTSRSATTRASSEVYTEKKFRVGQFRGGKYPEVRADEASVSESCELGVQEDGARRISRTRYGSGAP